MRINKAILLAAAVVSVPGCATRSYVDQTVATLATRQDAQEEQIRELSSTARQALERAIAAGELAEGKFLYSIVYSDDEIMFDTNSAALSSSMSAELVELAGNLKAENQNVYMEIQGHTDSNGSEAYNQQLGLRRAEAVRRSLYAEGVALDRMATISYGEDEPVASNDTAEGRARNRRVVIVVLE